MLKRSSANRTYATPVSSAAPSIKCVSIYKYVSLIVFAPLLAGCNFGGPSTVEAPPVDPVESARLAMETYDTNQDGVIAGTEIEAAASLASVMVELDADGDKKISAEEIQACVESWLASGTNMMSASCSVSVAGAPLQGATVTFEPEKFLGGAITTATGVTDAQGTAILVSEEAKKKNFPDGLAAGFYTVKISKMANGAEVVPEKYNASTTLGKALSPNARQNKLDFNLSRN